MKIVLSMLLFAGVACAQAGTHWILLPATAAPEAAKQCSRGAPKVDGGWDPTTQDIAGLEQRLPAIARLEAGINGHSLHIEHPEQTYRQYVGVIVGGHRLIYVNAVGGPFEKYAREHVEIVCDGGSSFWGVLYDPATGRFFDLQTNGPY